MLGLAQRRHPVAGSRGGVGCRGPASREQQFSMKGKLRLVLSKWKYRETRIARVVKGDKL